MRFYLFLLASSWVLAQSLELYPNYHTVGVIVDLAAGTDPNQNGSVSLQYQLDSGPVRTGWPLTRVNASRFVGSIFDCEEGQVVDVTVQGTDPDGGPLASLLLMGTTTTRTTVVFPTALRNRYVSPTGSGSTCSSGAPCSLATAIGSAQAGDHIWLADGTYFVGDFSFGQAGTSPNPIVLRNQVGANPVLDGSVPGTLPFVDLGNQTIRYTVPSDDTNNVFVDGKRLYPYRSTSEFNSLSWGLSGFLPNSGSSTELELHFLTAVDPNSLQVRVSRFNVAIVLNQNYIHLEGLTFQHYGAGAYGKAIYINDSSNHVIRNCLFRNNDLGVGLKRAAHRNTIENCQFYDDTFLWPWDGVKAGSNLETGGVAFYSPTSGRGNVIRNNHFENYFDGLASSPEDNGTSTNETDVYGNSVLYAGDDGLSADGQASNERIFDNVFSDVLVGISLAPVLEGPVYCLRNLITRTGQGNSQYTGLPFKFNVSGQPTAGISYLFHNTSDAGVAGQDGFWLKSPGTWQGIVMRNNIWIGTNHALYNANTSQPLDMDYDLLLHDGSASYVRWGGNDYANLAAFTGGTGQNANGLEMDPLFIDAANGNYGLQAGSPAINAGVLLPGINDLDPFPDLGAFPFAAPLLADWSAWRARLGDGNYQLGQDRNQDGVIDILDWVTP
ncbi:MAG: right-handed parallel beta-helix repeat-containing protein [Acidobacteria bacterium]|nr:right-handed parallel beta-helix repeat-containing protein [Acidobacteriota bacterium]MCB9398712.1 right-handed parallel beta-helix repeat-containing protein [Acidobacteriota bacterium]